MTSKSPGRAVPTDAADAASRSWWAFQYYHPTSAADPQLSYVTGYRRAVADMMADQFGFAGWEPLTRRLLEVLEELAIERQAVRMDTRD